jgi:hypothetical protein
MKAIPGPVVQACSPAFSRSPRNFTTLGTIHRSLHRSLLIALSDSFVTRSASPLSITPLGPHRWQNPTQAAVFYITKCPFVHAAALPPLQEISLTLQLYSGTNTQNGPTMQVKLTIEAHSGQAQLKFYGSKVVT